MTPQERQLIDDLFARLSKVEGAPRDPDAIAAITQGLRDGAERDLCAGADRAGAGRSAEAGARPHRGTGRRRRAATAAAVRQLPRFDARRGFRVKPVARLGAERPRARHDAGTRQPPGLEQRPGDAAGARRPGRLRSGPRLRATDQGYGQQGLRPAGLWRAARQPDGRRVRRWRRRFVSRHRGGGGGRRGRRLAVAQQLPRHDGRMGGGRQAFGDTALARRRTAVAVERSVRQQISRAMPASTISARKDQDLAAQDRAQDAEQDREDDNNSRTGFFDSASNDDDDDDHDSDGFDGDGDSDYA